MCCQVQKYQTEKLNKRKRNKDGSKKKEEKKDINQETDRLKVEKEELTLSIM